MKKIRLIELFAGIGSQAKALERLGVDFETHRVVEFDKYAVCSYNAIHGTNFPVGDVTKISGADLGITETDKYVYILTYSFPCQDLSLAGKQKGMQKGSGTRSGLLWEVERLLNECSELPQILLMENVPQVHSEENRPDFYKWLDFLESKGYANHYQDLNAKNYGIPQNRERCFMVSVLQNGEFEPLPMSNFLETNYYEFPKPFKLKLKLKDMLESDVDESYYLDDAQISKIQSSSFNTQQSRIQQKEWCDTLCARDYKDPKCVCIGSLSGGRLDKWNESCRRVYSPNGCSLALITCGGGHQEVKIIEPNCIIDDTQNFDGVRVYKKYSPALRSNRQGLKFVDNDSRIRKLTQKECWRLMGFDDSDFEKAKKALNETFYAGKDRSGSQLYKQAGNSIVVNVLEQIFKKVVEMIDR